MFARTSTSNQNTKVDNRYSTFNVMDWDQVQYQGWLRLRVEKNSFQS